MPVPKIAALKSPQDKIAFITGGAGGIGLALGRVFLAAGMKVVLADLREEALEGLRSQFDEGSVHLMKLDVTDGRAVERAAEETERLFGGVDVLCNNAGVNLFGPLSSAEPEDLRWVIDVNLHGVLNGLTAFVPRIKARGAGGHILNTASVAALVGSPRAPIYAASKAAVCALSESLWYELAPHGIGVSILCPGLVKSEIYRCWELHPSRPTAPPEVERLKEVHANGMEPKEVAEKTLRAMLNNELYILTHPEHKDEFLQRSQQIAGSFPEEAVDPARAAFEQSRLKHQQVALERGREGLKD